MYEENMERICALLCLLSTIERREDDPAPLSRSAVRAMLRSGALDGLVLRKTDAVSVQVLSRAKKLLGRALAVSARVEGYLSQGYRIVLEGDPLWPQHLSKLKEDMPLYLFAKGNLALLKGRKVSVAGSRAISIKTGKRAERIGKVLAGQGLTVVSGGAKGVDSAAAWAALRAGGSVVVIPAVSADEFFAAKAHRDFCEAGKLLLLCETPPDEAFSAKKALTRNHTIYALGDVAMVIASRKGIGGSWSGARACLKHAWSPLYILDEDGQEYEGNAALIDMGAMRMQIIRENGRDELLLQGMDSQMLRRVVDAEKQKPSHPIPVCIPVRIDSIPRREMLRYLGWNGQTLDEQVKWQIETAEKMALESIRPAVVIGEFDLAKGMQLSGTSFAPRGEAASLLLEGCQGVVLMAATLGAESERMLLRAQAVDAALAAVLDAVLSAAIEAVCDRACEEISARAKIRARTTTGRFSPGYGDMPMEQTREICEALDAAKRIGLTVSASGLMMPRKSVCAIIGEGENVGKNTRAGCAFCAMRESCKTKKTGKCACAPAEE